MPAERIAENLAFINWTVLTGLAFGSFAAVVLARLRTEATRGFLAFTAPCAVGLGLLAWLSDQALPAAVVGSPIRSPTRRSTCRAGSRWPPSACWPPPTSWRSSGAAGAPLLAAAGLTAAAATLVFGALAWGGGSLGRGPAPRSSWRPGDRDRRRLRGDDPGPLVPRHAEAAGGAAGPVLARPPGRRRPPGRPVRASGSRPAPGPAGGGAVRRLVGPWALFVWLRLIVGLVFPLIVSWAALQTARSRSMESATGLLYINVGTIAAGTILAAGLYFGAGLLV